jgi:hypothetical protein
VRLDVLEHLLGLREISSIPLSFEFFSFFFVVTLSPLSPLPLSLVLYFHGQRRKTDHICAVRNRCFEQPRQQCVGHLHSLPSCQQRPIERGCMRGES